MTFTVCFDALGTCFTLRDLVEEVEKSYGDKLRAKGWGAKGFVNDWFHSAQRDYTYLSLISPPPPPIASLLKTSLPFSLSAALSIAPPSSSSLEPITSHLSSLPAAPTLKEAFSSLSQGGGKLIIVTNGAQKSTEGYAEKAGISQFVAKVLSCDDVGLAKPHKEVYEAANKACEELEGENAQGDRWFVAAHIWDLAAAKKAGFKTALVLPDIPSEVVQSDTSSRELQEWYKIYGGRPDMVCSTLLQAAHAILEQTRSTGASQASSTRGTHKYGDGTEECPEQDADGPQLTGEEGQVPPDRATMLLI